MIASNEAGFSSVATAACGTATAKIAITKNFRIPIFKSMCVPPPGNINDFWFGKKRATREFTEISQKVEAGVTPLDRRGPSGSNRIAFSTLLTPVCHVGG
jgi:hypothetical protein